MGEATALAASDESTLPCAAALVAGNTLAIEALANAVSEAAAGNATVDRLAVCKKALLSIVVTLVGRFCCQ